MRHGVSAASAPWRRAACGASREEYSRFPATERVGAQSATEVFLVWRVPLYIRQFGRRSFHLFVGRGR
eukprot:173827-Pleurochrysis_carterae.AAC.2